MLAKLEICSKVNSVIYAAVLDWFTGEKSRVRPISNQRMFIFVVGYAKNGPDDQLQSIGFFACILHAVIGDVSLLCFLSVLRINNLRVFNTCAGSTPVASTIF